MRHSFTTYQKGGRQKGWRRSLGTAINTTTTIPTTTTSPQLLQMKRWGEKSSEEEPQKTQSHSHSCSFGSLPVILGGITNRMQGLKFNLSAVYGNLQYSSNYLQYKSNYTSRHEHVKYCGQPPQPARQQQGQLISKEASSSGKELKKRLTITIVGWHFSRPKQV